MVYGLLLQDSKVQWKQMGMGQMHKWVKQAELTNRKGGE